MTRSLLLEASLHAPEAMPGDPSPYAGPDSFTFICVRLRDLDGREGYGFTGRFLAPEAVHFLNNSVAEVLRREGEEAAGKLMDRFNPRGMTGVVVSALSALDLALWDLRARRAGVNVAALLGGARNSAPVHVTCGFPELDTDALVEACGREVESGARGVKVLVAARGRSLAEDMERLRAVREAIGTDADLIADANCGMDLETATEFARPAAGLDLAWLEEPIRRNDRHGLAALAAERIVRLGAGQMEQSAERFELLCEANVDVIQPNAVFAGGLMPAVEAARRACSLDRLVSPAGGWDAVNLQWMCGAFGSGPVELHRAQARIARLLFKEGQKISEGHLHLPDAPGFGYDPDVEGLFRCRIG